MSASSPDVRSQLLSSAQALRWQVGGNVHESVVELVYTEAARIADRAVTRPGEKERFDFDRALDRIVTSRTWGFPIMVLMFAVDLLADHHRGQHPFTDAVVRADRRPSTRRCIRWLTPSACRGG